MLQAKSKEGGGEREREECRNEMIRIMEMLLELLWSKMS